MATIFKPINSYLNYVDERDNAKLNDTVKKYVQFLKKVDVSDKELDWSKNEIVKEISDRLEASFAFSAYGEILLLNNDNDSPKNEKWDDFFLLSARNYQKIIEIIGMHNLDLLTKEEIYQLQLLAFIEFHSARRHAIASAGGQKVLKTLGDLETNKIEYNRNLIEFHRLIIHFFLANYEYCKTNIPPLLEKKIVELKTIEGSDFELYESIAICYILRAILKFIIFIENGDSQDLDQAFKEINESCKFSNASLRTDLRFFSNKLTLSFNVLSILSIWNIRVIFNVRKDESKKAINEYIALKIRNKNYFLFISQYEALFREKIFENFGNTVISLPTGSGKTLLAELSIIKRLIEVKIEQGSVKTHLLYLVPSRALAREKFDDFSKIFSPLSILKINVCQLTGELVLNSHDAFERNDVLIMTQEKFDMLLRDQFFGATIDTLIVDEFHNIRSGHRGIKLEFAILRFKGLPQFQNTKIILISAIVKKENFKEIGNWIFAENLFQTEWRPTFTRIGILNLSSPERMIEFNDGISIESNIPSDIRSSATKKAATWLTLNYAQKDPVLFFTTYTTDPFTQNNHLLDIASTFCDGSTSFTFNRESNARLASQLKRIVGNEKILHYFQQGVGVHWGFLPHSIRRIMERAVREKALNVIISTSTLAEGVNLPIKTIIIPRLKIQDRYIDFGLFFNLIGRAGRPFMHEEGQVILLASDSGPHKTPISEVNRFYQASRSDIEDIKSPVIQILDLRDGRIPYLTEECLKRQNKNKERILSQAKKDLELDVANFETVLLAMIAEGLIDSLADNQQLIDRITIGKFSAEERKKILDLLKEIETRFIEKYRVILRNDNLLETTPFGEVVYRTGLSPESCYILYNQFLEIAPKIVDISFAPKQLFKKENFETFKLIYNPINTIIEANAFFKYGFPFDAPQVLMKWMKGLTIEEISSHFQQKDSPTIETMIMVENQLSTFSSWYFNSLHQIISYIHEEKGIRDPRGLKSISLLTDYSWYGTIQQNAIKIMNLDISRELIRDDILLLIKNTRPNFIEKILDNPDILQANEVIVFINNINGLKMEPEEFRTSLYKVIRSE